MFLILDNVCSDYALAGTLATIRTIFQIICLAVPIILIISLVVSIISMISNPDEKGGIKKIINKFIAALIVFFLPTIVNLSMGFLKYALTDNSSIYDVVVCFDEALEIDKIVKETPSFNTSVTKDYSFDKLVAKLQRVVEYKKVTNTYQSGGMNIPSYYQGDYPDIIFIGNQTVANSGCGFTSAAMVASYLTGDSITPDKLVSWSRQYFVPNAGMSWDLPKAVADHYNLGSVVATTSIDEVVKALKNMQPVMSSQRKGLFTQTNHIIVLRGVTKDNKILVNDPNKTNAVTKGYNNREFSLSEVNNTAKQYWIFEAKK